MISDMANDPKDRPVLAAAIRGGAEVLVTENHRDFPPHAVRPYGIEVISQDAFLLDQFDLRPADATGCTTTSRPHSRPVGR
jgi:predicted nucleic acid-binding protein